MTAADPMSTMSSFLAAIGTRLRPGAALCLLALLIPGAQAAAEPGRLLLARLEHMLDRMTVTAYQGATEIDEAAGSLKCDCSGLIGHVLRNLCPEAYLSVRGMEAPWRIRPQSVTFHETFTAAAEGRGNGRWLAVAKLMEVRPGDILAWRTETVVEGQSSGHVAMIASEPVVEKDGRVRFRVIDSTRSPHSNDTRTETSLGVGSGDMYFVMDGEGKPTGFHVRGDGPMSRHAFAFARVADLGDESPAALDAPADADYIGLTLAEAMALVGQRKLEARVIEEDGRVMPVAARLTGQRVNFVVQSGKVLRALRG